MTSKQNIKNFLHITKQAFWRKNKNFTWKYKDIEKIAEHFKTTEQEIAKTLRG